MNRDLRRMLDAMSTNEVHNYVLPGLTSALIGGEGRGQVRILNSDRDTREWVTPHSHRFDFVCLVLAGQVENIVFTRGQGNYYAKGMIKPVEGGMGKYQVSRTSEWGGYVEHSTTYTEGECYSMRADEIHSIRFSRGAEVLFFEGPNVRDFSVFLEPWSNGRAVPTFETRSWMFEPASRPSSEEKTK